MFPDIQSHKQVKIAFFVSEFPVLSETFIVNQIVDLKQKGYRVRIYARERGCQRIVHKKINEHELLSDTKFLSDFPKQRIKKVGCLLKALIKSPSIKNLLLTINFIKKASHQGLSVYDLMPFIGLDFAVVHAHFGSNGLFVAKLRALGLFQSSRFVTTFHGYDLEPTFSGIQLYEQVFRSCDVVTVNSEFAKQKLLDLKCSSEKIIKLPVGLDTKWFRKEETELYKKVNFTILFVGRLILLKGPDIVIEICRYLKERYGVPFQAILVGDGEEQKTIRELINVYNLQQEVLMAGARSQEEIKTLMATADVFLLPGRTINGRAETQGLVIQEAQAMGLPVVVSDAGGMKEGIIDGVTGFVIPEGNTALFAEKIVMLATSTSKRKEMATEGRKFVEEHYAICGLNDKLLSSVYAHHL